MTDDLEQQVRASLRKDTSIQVGKVIWPKSWEGPRSDQQQRSLMERLMESKEGLIVDCSGVEVGNSEIVTLLMRIRNHANKSGKQFVIFSVPDTLKELLRICNLTSVILTANDEDSARTLLRKKRSGKGSEKSKWAWLMPWKK